MKQKNDLMHRLTTSEALDLFGDAYRHHHKHLPDIGILDRINRDIGEGKDIYLVPVFRLLGRSRYETLRCLIVHKNEVLEIIDASFEAIEQLSGWNRFQFGELPRF